MFDNKIDQMEYKQSKYGLYSVLCALFFFLYFIRDVLGVGIPIYLIYAISLTIVLICDFSCVVAFFVSFSALSNTGFDSVAIIALFIAFFIRYVGFCKAKLIINRNYILLIVMVYELFHYLVNDYALLTTVIKYVIFILISFLIFSLPGNSIDRKVVISSFVCFSAAYVLLTILISLNLMSWNIGYLISEGLRAKEYADAINGTQRYILGNQNFISAVCSVNMGICVWKIIKNKKRLLNIILMFFFFFSGLLTISKLFFGILFFFFILFVYLMWKKNPRFGITAFFAGIIFILLTFVLFGDTLITLIFNRFRSGMMSGDVTTGRVSTYELLFDYLRENVGALFFGTGILNLVYVLGDAVHSSILEVIGGWGILGLPFFILLIRMVVKNAYDYRSRNSLKINYLTYIPLVIGVVYSFGGMLFGEPGSFLRIALYMYILMEGETKNEI